MQHESKGIQPTELESGTPYDILAGVEGGFCWVVRPIGTNHHVVQFALWARLHMAAHR
jgi:hypothetical protein